MGIYIVAMGALFFLAFAFFAVGQATNVRSKAQTAADSAALAAARQNRDEVKIAFLRALDTGNSDILGQLLNNAGTDDGAACQAARQYAGDNRATVRQCERVGSGVGYTVSVITDDTVGSSVIEGTESKHAEATATAVVEPRCSLGTDAKSGHAMRFTCDGGPMTIDPSAQGFTLDLSDFYSVHLSK